MGFQIIIIIFLLLMPTSIQLMQILFVKVLFLAEAAIQVPSVDNFKKLSKFIRNQYFSYLHLSFEAVLLALKSHNHKNMHCF